MFLEDTALSLSWSRQEFSGLDFGDRRLNDRFIDVADALASHPESTINAACGDWSLSNKRYAAFTDTPNLSLIHI